MKKLLVSIAALTLAAGAFAQAPAAPAATPGAAPTTAAKPAGGKAHRLNKLDTNKDGQISAAEAKGHPRLEKNFAAIDTNKDGQLSRDELKAFRAAHKGEHKGERPTKATPAPKA